MIADVLSTIKDQNNQNIHGGSKTNNLWPRSCSVFGPNDDIVFWRNYKKYPVL